MRSLKRFLALTAFSLVSLFLASCTNNNETNNNEYDSNEEQFTVNWKNSDGTILETDIVNRGETPVYDGDTPSINNPGQINTFSNWDKEIKPCDNNIDYIAVYETEYIEYTINFVVDGETINSDIYRYGETVTPPQVSDKLDDSYQYIFSGWNPTIETVSKNMTYTAVFQTETRKYSVVFKNYNGDILDSKKYSYGENIDYPNFVPTRQSDDNYDYEFSNWDKEIEKCTGDVVITACYNSSPNKFTISWCNYDGSVLKTSTVKKGIVPQYDGDTPTRESSVSVNYTFDGWNKEIVAATDNETYTATFDESPRSYVITWKNGDDILQQTEVEYGQYPEYKGPVPVKAGTLKYTYSYKNWDKVVVNVSGDETYTAVFDQTINKYTVSWCNYDNSLIYSEKVEYDVLPVYSGTTPTKPSDSEYDYEFSGWSPQPTLVTGEITYVAQFNSIGIVYIHKIDIKGISVEEKETAGEYDTEVIATIYYKYVAGEDGYYLDEKCTNNLVNYSSIFTTDVYEHFNITGIYKNAISNNGHSNASTSQSISLLDASGNFVVGKGRLYQNNAEVYALASPKKYTSKFELNAATYGTTTGSAPNGLEYYYNEKFTNTITVPENTYYYAIYSKDNVEYFDKDGNPKDVAFKYGSTDNTLTISWVKKYDGVYIETIDDFKSINDNSNTFTSYYLVTDLDFDGEALESIHILNGNFYGCGHKIYNFSITVNNRSGDDIYVGLFDKTAENSSIVDLIVGNDNYDTRYNVDKTETSNLTTVYVGAILGYSQNTDISNCTVNNISINVTLQDNNNNQHLFLYLGGAIGYSDGGTCRNITVKNCNIEGILNAKVDSGDDQIGSCGGIVGKSNNLVSYCSVINTEISLSAFGDGVGGLFQTTNLSEPKTYLGGIVGTETSESVSNCVVNNVSLLAIGGHGGWTSPSFSIGFIIGFDDECQGESDNVITNTDPIQWKTLDAGNVSKSGTKEDNIGVLFNIPRKQ